MFLFNIFKEGHAKNDPVYWPYNALTYCLITPKE